MCGPFLQLWTLYTLTSCSLLVKLASDLMRGATKMVQEGFFRSPFICGKNVNNWQKNLLLGKNANI